MVDDGAGDKLGEKRDEQAIVDEIRIPDFALVDVDQIGDLLKCEEGYGQWQDDVAAAKTGTRKVVDGVQEELGVLEIGDEAQVEDHADEQQSPRGRTR